MYSEGSGNGSILAKSKARALLCRTMCVSYIRKHKYSLNITEKKYCFGKKFLECFLVIFREYVVIIFLWLVFFTWFLSPLLEKGEVNGTSTMVPWSLPCFISTTREGRSYLYLEVPVATQARNRTTPKTTLTIIMSFFFLLFFYCRFSSVFSPLLLRKKRTSCKVCEESNAFFFLSFSASQ